MLTKLNVQELISQVITQHKLEVLKEECDKFIASLKKVNKNG